VAHNVRYWPKAVRNLPNFRYKQLPTKFELAINLKTAKALA
jgi:hypothetical protein